MKTKFSRKFAEFTWIAQYAKRHIGLIVVYTVFGMAGTVTGLMSSLVSRDLVDIITGHKTGELIKTFVIMAVVSFATMMVGQVSSYISAWINQKFTNEIKAEMFDKIMESEWESLSRFHSGALMARWSGDTSIVASGVLTLFSNAFLRVFRFASALWLVVSNDASFAVIVMITVPISALTSRMAMKKLSKSNMEATTANVRLSSLNQETFANIQTVKAFDLVNVYSKELRECQDEAGRAQLKQQRNMMINAMISSIVAQLISYVSYGWGIYRVWHGDITYGSMTMFLGLSTSLSGTMNSLIGLGPSSISILNAAKRLMEIERLPKEDYSQHEEVARFFEENSDKGVGVCIRNVEYAYPDSDTVFSGVDIDAHPHEIIALVGPSGEGKTTMLRYILSIIKPQEGAGYLCAGANTPENGRNMPLTASVRQLMAYVPQGNTMFSGTIAENMRKVKQDATDDEIINALKMACAWNFVEKLPQGIDSPIMERGGGFSEGQAQRLSIARAILRKSPILLLDEATSALDVKTERDVLRNIMADDYPRTCIVTTHRPTVLNVCNRVYAIKDKGCSLMSEDEISEMIMDF